MKDERLPGSDSQNDCLELNIDIPPVFVPKVLVPPPNGFVPVVLAPKPVLFVLVPKPVQAKHLETIVIIFEM